MVGAIKKADASFKNRESTTHMLTLMIDKLSSLALKATEKNFQQKEESRQTRAEFFSNDHTTLVDKHSLRFSLSGGTNGSAATVFLQVGRSIAGLQVI